MSAILIIKTLGLLGIFLAVFAESGLFIGFFLPGDSLLFVAGLLAAGGHFDIAMLILLCIVAAILGDTLGYWTGRKWARRFFEKDRGFLFKKQRLIDAEEFYATHGRYTIVLARFIPVIRTFAPIVAGIANMPYRTFLAYNIIGGILWASILPLLGYFLGHVIPNPDTYIMPIVVLIVLMSILPVVYKYIRRK
jgi:membrane-associated protein